MQMFQSILPRIADFHCPLFFKQQTCSYSRQNVNMGTAPKTKVKVKSCAHSSEWPNCLYCWHGDRSRYTRADPTKTQWRNNSLGATNRRRPGESSALLLEFFKSLSRTYVYIPFETYYYTPLNILTQSSHIIFHFFSVVSHCIVNTWLAWRCRKENKYIFLILGWTVPLSIKHFI